MITIFIDRPISVVPIDHGPATEDPFAILFRNMGDHHIGDEQHPRTYLVGVEVQVIMVLRNGVRIADLTQGVYARCKTAASPGSEPYLASSAKGKPHTKVSVFEISEAPDDEVIKPLSRFISEAPPGRSYRGGRPRMSDQEYVERGNISLLPTHWGQLANLGKGNKSEGVREALRLVEPFSPGVMRQIVDRVFADLGLASDDNQRQRATRIILEEVSARRAPRKAKL